MDAAQILILAAAFLFANLPFLVPRSLFGWPRLNGAKPFYQALVELLLLYFALGGVSRLLEHNAYGSAYSQSWEFYAITLALFVVFAYPGFVYRYLWQRKK